MSQRKSFHTYSKKKGTEAFEKLWVAKYFQQFFFAVWHRVNQQKLLPVILSTRKSSSFFERWFFSNKSAGRTLTVLHLVQNTCACCRLGIKQNVQVIFFTTKISSTWQSASTVKWLRLPFVYGWMMSFVSNVAGCEILHRKFLFPSGGFGKL